MFGGVGGGELGELLVELSAASLHLAQCLGADPLDLGALPRTDAGDLGLGTLSQRVLPGGAGHVELAGLGLDRLTHLGQGPVAGRLNHAAHGIHQAAQKVAGRLVEGLVGVRTHRVGASLQSRWRGSTRGSC